MLTDTLMCDNIGFDPNEVYFSTKVIDLHSKQIWLCMYELTWLR